MVNVTITVPQELKDKMDKYSEVSWSEISRNAISKYIAQREAPIPRIELEVRQTAITVYNNNTGYPTLTIDLKIHNKMNSKIMVDRILANAWTDAKARRVILGQAHELRRRIINPNSAGWATIELTFPREKLEEFRDIHFTRTFDCRVYCWVFVDDFQNEYQQEISFRIPIDVWDNILNEALEGGQTAQ